MTPVYTYSLVPIISVSLLLFTSLLVHGQSMRGLTLYCASIAVWSGALFLISFPQTAELAKYLAHIGAFVSASFIHTAYDFTKQARYGLVWLAYLAAALITLVGIVWPGLLYSPASLAAGPAFWPSMVLAVAATALPLYQIATAYRTAPLARKRTLRTLALSAVLGFLGAWINAMFLSHGLVTPYPMFMVLASLLVLTGLVRHTQSEAGQKLLDRSLVYAALTALLSAGFLFAVITALQYSGESALSGHWIGTFFLLFMAALAFEPLRQWVQKLLARVIVKQHARSEDLAHALADQEARADQAERLAELGTFAAAVAHEVRNPLGVIAAHLRALELDIDNRQAREAIREQVRRASAFIDDLLRYGRPRPLDLRMVDVGATVQLARSTAVAAASDSPDIRWDGVESLPQILIEADQGQLTQVFTILFENALLALQGREAPVCQVQMTKKDGLVRVVVADNGPGIPREIAARVFEPFVTGRKREGPSRQWSSGTGLGLAIARGIVQRHQGSIQAGRSHIGGARIEVALPAVQKLLTNESGPKR